MRQETIPEILEKTGDNIGSIKRCNTCQRKKKKINKRLSKTHTGHIILLGFCGFITALHLQITKDMEKIGLFKMPS